MNRDQKAAVIDEVAAQLQAAEAVYAVDYRGTSVPQAAELRTKLRDVDTRFRVVKNTLTERAADKAGAEALKQYLDGPTALVFVNGDAAVAAKALADFRRASGLLEFKGGWMGGDVLTAEQIDAIAKLPSREVLYGRLVGMVASPLTGLATSLNGLLGGLARQLQQIADQRNQEEHQHGYQHPGVDRRAEVDLRSRALRAHQGPRGGVRRLGDGRRGGRPGRRRRR